MYKNDFLSYELSGEIAVITINQLKEPANLFSMAFLEEYYKAARQAIEDSHVKGVLVTSGQRIFMAGADLRMMGAKMDQKDLYSGILGVHRKLRDIEKSGKPFVAAISGTALGGGLELALACHHRIALDDASIKIGCPESKVGLLPGAGGTAKFPYLCGIQQGLTLLLQGTELRPKDALAAGLINELAQDPDELKKKAENWIKGNPSPVQPWDNRKYRMPGGAFWSPEGVQTMMGAAGNVGKLTHGNYPAQKYILSAVHDGLQLPIDRALEVEARYFTKVANTKEAKNIIRTGFLEMQAARKGKARPKNEPKYEVNKLGMLGAGMMGAGIAYVSAKAGMEVVLKDVSLAAAEKGKSYSRTLLDAAIAKGRSTNEKAAALLDRIHTTDDPSAVKDCDLIIEAVFEDPSLKDKVTKETEAVLGIDKIYGSNTSTIPISLLAKSSSRPENFIGIHFFSPVDKMPLVEIIVAKKTGNKAIAAALDYTMAIGKIPIVVNDSRGFFTSRCFGTYVSEGMFLLEEGVPPAMIENIARKKGMPVGPLAVHDEVTLTLSRHVFDSNPDPKSEAQERAHQITLKMIAHGRTGKKDGAGFYDYPKDAKKKLWPGLKELFPVDRDLLDEETIGKRLFHFQALESYRCLEEGVLRNATDGDLGSVLGWGFPIYTGGAISYIDYIGIREFVRECDDFSKRFGKRFEVPYSLRTLSESGKSVHDFGK